MDSFVDALLSVKTDKIPDEYDCLHRLLVIGIVITMMNLMVKKDM